MRIDIVTLFPDFFASPLSQSIPKRAQEKSLLDINIVDLRNFGLGNYKQVDDTPYGGGAGMVIRADVAAASIKSLSKEGKLFVVNFSPKGKHLTQKLVQELSMKPHLALFNAHYEGVDQRFIDKYVDLEISVGDFILSGGESASLLLIDSIARLLPGVLGNQESPQEESFSIQDETGQLLLEYPQYTKPAQFEGESVSEVLLSGDHTKIKQWRLKQAKMETQRSEIANRKSESRGSK